MGVENKGAKMDHIELNILTEAIRAAIVGCCHDIKCREHDNDERQGMKYKGFAKFRRYYQCACCKGFVVVP